MVDREKDEVCALWIWERIAQSIRSVKDEINNVFSCQETRAVGQSLFGAV